MSGPARYAPVVLVAAAVLLSGCSIGGVERAEGSEVVNLQPGLPGEPNRTVSPEEVEGEAVTASPFSDADVAFLHDMRVHHEQALTMTALVEERTDREDVLLFVRRMDISQTAEIEQLERMIAEHEEALRGTGGSMPHGGHGAHGDPGDHDASGSHGSHTTHGDHRAMPGMLSEDELAAMAAATGDEFVRLFLEGMTRHHEGALVMVEQLLAVDGAAADPRLLRFANHVDSDQRIELERMARLYGELPQS